MDQRPRLFRRGSSSEVVRKLQKFQQKTEIGGNGRQAQRAFS